MLNYLVSGTGIPSETYVVTNTTIGGGGADITTQGPIGNHGTDTTFGSATPLTAQGGMGSGGGNSNPVLPIAGGTHGSGVIGENNQPYSCFACKVSWENKVGNTYFILKILA